MPHSKIHFNLEDAHVQPCGVEIIVEAHLCPHEAQVIAEAIIKHKNRDLENFIISIATLLEFAKRNREEVDPTKQN